MPRWNTQTIIAGVDFSACRAVILNGKKFKSGYVGSITKAASAMPHVQRWPRPNDGMAGINFGAGMERADAEMIQSAHEAIEAAETAGDPFRVQMTNALYTIDLLVYPDYSLEDWFEEGQEDEGIIEGVSFHFCALASYTAP